MTDRWKYIDRAAIVLGLAGLLVLFFNFPDLGFKAEAVVCAVLGSAGLCYLLGGIWMWHRRRIEFDLLLVKGNFLRKVVCLVVLFPYTLTLAVLLCGLDAETMLVMNESEAQVEIPSLLWTVYYHIIDPGNQHMTDSGVALGWTAVFGVLGILLLGGLLVSTLINWFDKRREQWLSGSIRYGESQFGQGRKFAVVIGANEIAPSVIRNLLDSGSCRDGHDKQLDHSSNYGHDSQENHGSHAGHADHDSREGDKINFRRESRNAYVVLQTSRDPGRVRSELSSYLTDEDLDRVVIYSALRDSAKEISKLHPWMATEIYVLGESSSCESGESSHDALNMKCVNLLAAVMETGVRIHRKVCKVLFEYQTTYSVFQFSDIPDAVRRNLVFIPFNRHECWAQRVMVDGVFRNPSFPDRKIAYTPLDGYGGISAESDDFVHLVIVGMSKMGVAMGIEAAFQAHYPNFRRARTRISFISSDADREMAFLAGRYKALFELARCKYADAANCRVEDFDSARGWIDPMESDGCRWKHLSEGGKNFIDVEFEFIKGEVESEGVRNYLRAVSAEENARLTLAVCLNRTHQAIAASLYLPLAVYRKAQEIWVLQQEASDMMENLGNASVRDERYEKLRPFGMFNGEYMRDRSSYIKSVLVNGAYDLGGDRFRMEERDIADKSTWADLRAAWKSLTVSQQWSNRYFVDSMYQKLRSVCGELAADMFADTGLQSRLERAIADNRRQLSECEHNRWTVQQLLMEFRPADAEVFAEFREMNSRLKAAEPSRNAWREKVGWNSLGKEEQSALKLTPEYMSTEYGRAEKMISERKKALKYGACRIHPDICSYSLLDEVDPGAKQYDEYLNSAIPYILIMVDGHGKLKVKPKDRKQ